MQRRLLRIAAGASALLVGLAGGYLYRGRTLASNAPVSAASAHRTRPPASSPSSSSAATSIAAPPDSTGIVEQYGPAVLNLTCCTPNP